MEIIDGITEHQTLSAEQVEYKGLRLKPGWQIFLGLPIELGGDDFFAPEIKLVFERVEGSEAKEVDFIDTLRLEDLKSFKAALSLAYLLDPSELIKAKLERALVHVIAPRAKVLIEYVSASHPDHPSINYTVTADNLVEDIQYPFGDYSDVFELTGDE
jgi:hypothetical protein